MTDSIRSFLKQNCAAQEEELTQFFDFFNFSDEIDGHNELLIFAFNSLRDKKLETRNPYVIVDGDGKIVALGLADSIKDVIDILNVQNKVFDLSHSIKPITREKYNEYLDSIDYPTWHIFGE